MLPETSNDFIGDVTDSSLLLIREARNQGMTCFQSCCEYADRFLQSEVIRTGARHATVFAFPIFLTTFCNLCPLCCLQKKSQCLLLKSKQGPVIAEPLAFYQLPTGEWWLEYTPMYTHAQVKSLEEEKERCVTNNHILVL